MQRFLPFAALAFALCSAACGGPATASVTMRNTFPATAFTLCQVSYSGVRWDAQINPGASAAPRNVPAVSDYAYALGVFGSTNCADAANPPIVLRTKTPFETTPAGTATLEWTFATHTGKCGTPALTQADYETIATGQFPGATVAAFASVMCPAP